MATSISRNGWIKAVCHRVAPCAGVRTRFGTDSMMSSAGVPFKFSGAPKTAIHQEAGAAQGETAGAFDLSVIFKSKV